MMIRRLAISGATSLLAMSLVGFAVVAARTPAGTSNSPAHSSARTHQAGNPQQTTKILYTSSIPGATSGEIGPGVIAINKGGEYTVTAIDGNTITATSNGPSIGSVALSSTTTAPYSGTTIISGSVSILDAPGKIAGPGLAMAAPVSGTSCQIITATSKLLVPGVQGGKTGLITKPALPLPVLAPMTVTITVNDATVYDRAGHTASLSDIQVGSILDVKGAPTAPGAISASEIQIVVPQRSGVVTAINGNSLTITAFDAETYTVTVDNDTLYQRASQTAALSDVAVGSLISVEGDLGSDNMTLHALSVLIQLPTLSGQVSAISGDTVTLKNPEGSTATLLLSDKTSYSAGPDGTADRSNITVGSFIMAEGVRGSDGTFNALHVSVAVMLKDGMSGTVTLPGTDATTASDSHI